MATVSADQKNIIEIVLDVGLVLVIGDIMYSTVFGQPPVVKFFHDIIAILGTIAAMWLGWKLARKNKALS